LRYFFDLLAKTWVESLIPKNITSSKNGTKTTTTHSENTKQLEEHPAAPKEKPSQLLPTKDRAARKTPQQQRRTKNRAFPSPPPEKKGAALHTFRFSTSFLQP